jgi:K+ transporter
MFELIRKPHFNLSILQLSFTFGLLPSVMLTYIGQAAYMRKHIDTLDISNVFFQSIPSMRDHKHCSSLVLLRALN